MKNGDFIFGEGGKGGGKLKNEIVVQVLIVIALLTKQDVCK